MFLDNVTLRKDGWYVKLLAYTFDVDALTYFSFCPVFWLTVLAIICVPVIAMIRGILHLISKGSDSFDRWMQESIDKKAETWADRWKSKLSMNEIALSYDVSRENVWSVPDCKRRRYDSLGNKIFSSYALYANMIEEVAKHTKTPEYKQFLANLKAQYDEEREKDLERERIDQERKKQRDKRAEARREKVQSRKQKLTKFIPVVKLITVVSLVLIGGTALYIVGFYAYILAIYIWDELLSTLRFWLFVAGIIGWLVSGVLLGILLNGIVELLKKTSTFWVRVGCWVAKVIGPRLTKVSLRIGEIVYDVVMFFVVGFRTFYSNNCPPVDWEDPREDV